VDQRRLELFVERAREFFSWVKQENQGGQIYEKLKFIRTKVEHSPLPVNLPQEDE